MNAELLHDDSNCSGINKILFKYSESTYFLTNKVPQLFSQEVRCEFIQSFLSLLLFTFTLHDSNMINTENLY